MRTKWKIASALSLIVVLLYAKDKCDIKAIGKLMSYAILIAAPIGVIVCKYKEKLNKIPKGLSALLMVAAMFLGRWLHSESFAAEYILAFVVSFLLIFVAFFFDEKDLKL